MEQWQLAATLVAALLSTGFMSFVIVRLFSRPSRSRASVREASAVESALVGAAVPADARIFDGWSYRVGARFAGRVRVAVYGDRVAVAGPRVPRALYRGWIWTQGSLLALVAPALVAAVLGLEWRWLLGAAGLFVASFAISTIGAGAWPGLGETEAVGNGGRFRALEFARADVSDVAIGKGWSAGGLGIVLLPYRKAIDAMAERFAVSFFAPDEDGREVRFAIHMYSEADARELAGLLGSGSAS